MLADLNNEKPYLVRPSLRPRGRKPLRTCPELGASRIYPFTEETRAAGCGVAIHMNQLYHGVEWYILVP